MVVARVLVLGPIADQALALMRSKYGNNTHFIRVSEYESNGVQSTSRFIKSGQSSHYERTLQRLLEGGTRDGVEAVLIGSQPSRSDFGSWNDFVLDFWNWRPVFELMSRDGVEWLHCRNGREDDIVPEPARV